ncbi:hypothetical protein RSOL_038120, partial [Rhizoctonia solani AG-3 Rhs1AP]
MMSSDSPPPEHDLFPPSAQYDQFSSYNALGLDLPANHPSLPVAVRSPSSTSSATQPATYYATTPHPSGYVRALMSDGLSIGPTSVPPSTSFGFEYLLSEPSPTYPLRPITPAAALLAQPSVASSAGGVSAPPQPPTVLPALAATLQFTVPLSVASKRGRQKTKPRKRKRIEQASPNDSDEEERTFPPQESRVRPNMLLAPSYTAPKNIQSATQHLAVVRPAPSNSDNDEEMANAACSLSKGDEEVVESLYEEPRGGDTVDLRRLCDLVHKILEDQAGLSHSVQQIDARTRRMITDPQNPPTAGGTHVSPPEPPPPVNWDQDIQYNAPAGRRRRAARRVLIMGLIRETIFWLLSRNSVHDPLPPPLPPGLRVPTKPNYGVRWQESSKSIFNLLAANVVAQTIVAEQPGMLSTIEVEELPTMVSKHIKYLCRCYKDQNREDTEDFNTRRLNRCAAGTRKRQVLDMFPESLGAHRHLIAHLGVDGTSSDEEEPKGSGVYKIKNKPQLSSKVTLLKRFVLV